MTVARIVVFLTGCTAVLAGLLSPVCARLMPQLSAGHWWITLAVVIDSIVLYATFERRAPFWGSLLSRGSTRASAVAITFDDGPIEPYTSQILDILAAYQARATFFVLGARAEASPHLLKRMFEEGHEIGNHTWDHQPLALKTPAAIRSTIRATSDIIERSVGIRPRVFRAPFGWRNPWVDRMARKEGCTAVAWTVGVHDTDRPGAYVIAQRSIDGLDNGVILLLHDGRSFDPAPDASQVVEALPRILTAVQRRGLRLLTMSEMLAESERDG